MNGDSEPKPVRPGAGKTLAKPEQSQPTASAGPSDLKHVVKACLLEAPDSALIVWLMLWIPCRYGCLRSELAVIFGMQTVELDAWLVQNYMNG